MVTNIKHIDIVSKANEDIFDGEFTNKPGKAIMAIKNITLTADQDVHLIINNSTAPLLVKKSLGLNIADASIKTIKTVENGVSIYAIFSY